MISIHRLTYPARIALCFIGAGIWVTVASAQTIVSINWGTGAQGITGNSNVSTAGTLVQASNLGGGSVSSATVNGVTFSSAPVTDNVASMSVGAFTLSESPSTLRSLGGASSANAPFSALSSDYQALLIEGASTYLPEGANTVRLTMPALTLGNVYLFQWWSSEYAGHESGSTRTAATGGISLTANTANVNGGLGEYGIGTFTASAASMYLAFDAVDAGQLPLINAFQLRDVTAVPEPSTYALGAGLGALALAVWRRRVGCLARHATIPAPAPSSRSG